MHDLINARIREAKEILSRALVADIRGVTLDPELDETTRQRRYESIEGCVWEYFEKGELDSSHLKMLRDLLREGSPYEDKVGAQAEKS